MSMRKAVITFCILVLHFLASGNIAYAAPRAVATVLAATGTLNVQRVGQNQVAALPVRGALYTGDIVTTGPNGRANLLFSDGSPVRMRENSRLEITAPETPKAGTSLFRALLGGIWSRLRPGRGAKTVYTNLVVRGTEFYVFVEPDGAATLTVIEGTVDFSNQFGAVQVNAAQQSLAEVGKAPTVPVTIDNPGLIIEWIQQIDFAAVPLEKFWTTADSISATRNVPQLRAANAGPLQIGEALFDAGDAGAALAQFVGQDANTQLHRGYALLKLARLDEAEAAFRVALADAPFTDAARVGLAWTLLARNKPQQAQEFVAPVVQANGANSEARLALAVSLLRQPNNGGQDNIEAAVNQLKAVADGPQNLRYQARAWLAAAYLAQGKNEEAQREAESAAKMVPTSALAQLQLAQISFFNNQSGQSLRAAKRVVAIDAESPGGQMALAQANLAAGRIDDAASAAARAVALDNKSPQGHYLLGVADAGRRDYRHAISSLRTALNLAPEFYPALNALARVYVRAGREKEASTLLAQYENRPANAQVLSARGEYYYNTGQYKKALADYRRALELNPGSALTWANAARTAIDDNQLSEAINAGQKAVQLAPNIGAHHAILGLAYDFSRMQTQAARSYRTALVLDPQNSLALVQLGRLQKDGDPRTTERVQALTFAQGFLLDPAISNELLRGGVSGQLGFAGGNRNRETQIIHRGINDDGKTHSFGEGFLGKDSGDRPNTNYERATVLENLTYQSNQRTSWLGHFLYRSDNGGIGGTLTTPNIDDRQHFGFQEGILGARHRLNRKIHLWGGLFASDQREFRTNPSTDPADAFSLVFPVRGDFALNAPITQGKTSAKATSPEVRLDYSLSDNPNRHQTLTLGYSKPRVTSRVNNILALPSLFPGAPPFPGTVQITQTAPTQTLYMQWDGKVNDRFSLSGQLRHERQVQTVTQTGELSLGGLIVDLSAPRVSRASSRWLPSVVSNYRVGKNTNARLLANRRMTARVESIFAPPGTLISTEDQVFPLGSPDPGLDGDLINYQLDVETYFNGGDLLKLFAFRSAGRNVTYDFSRFSNPGDADFNGLISPNSPVFDRISRSGIGGRIEKQILPGLFGQLGVVLNRTTAAATVFDITANAAVPLPFNGQTAPYHPRWGSQFGLNYVSPKGIKAGVFVNYSGSYFADDFNPATTPRPRRGGGATVDLTLASEPSVRGEVFLKVVNVFDRNQFVFNDVPLNGRRVTVGVNRRF